MFTAAQTYPYSLTTINTYGHNIYNIFRHLHILGIATSNVWMALRNESLDFRFAISNMLLENEYDMLAMSARLRQESLDGIEDEGLIAICDALVTAAQLFLFAALRFMPIGTRMVDIHLSRLRTSLQRPRLLEMWETYASLDALLWTLSISATAAMGRPERGVIMSELRNVCDILRIGSKETMIQHLKTFAWSDYWELASHAVFAELFTHKSEPVSGRPTDGFLIQDPQGPSIREIYDAINWRA